MGNPTFATPPSQSHLSIIPTNGVQNGSSSVYTHGAPIYQVDYTCVNAGKTLGASKRRIRWRFGFADNESIAMGKSGPNCRGEEHEIVLNWSLTSGKQVVLADGHEVHVSCKPYEMVFECNWTMRGNHVVRIKGHAKPAALRDADERQFDLRIDGRSFFHFDQIFALGHKSHNSRPNHREMVQEIPRPRPRIVTKQPPSENVEWPTKKNFNFDENTTPKTVSTMESSGSSFDFMSQPNTPVGNSNFQSAPAPTLESMPSMYEPQYAPNQEPQYASNQEPQYASNQWLPAGGANAAPYYYGAPIAPVAPINDEYEMQHRMNKVEYDVMEAYKTAPVTLENNNAIVPVQPAAQPQQSQNNYEIPLEISATAVPVQTGAETSAEQAANEAYFEGDEYYTTPMLEESDLVSVVAPPPSDPIDELVNKLCNLNDINSEPQEEVKLTLNPFKAGEGKNKKKKNPNKSTPTAPPASTWYGPQPTLAEMKAVVVPKTPTQDAMKPNVFHQQAGVVGQMVVYGQGPAMNEAPPLQQNPTGFGVGAQMNQGYGQHTAPQQQYHAPQQPQYTVHQQTYTAQSTQYQY